MILLPWPAEFGPIPRGMPLSGTRRNTQDRACGTLLKFCPGFLSHGYWRVLSDDGEWMMDDAEIDLSAPTNGERIDALPEVVARLARAMGLDPSNGAILRPTTGALRGFVLSVGPRPSESIEFCGHPPHAGRGGLMGRNPHVPALLDIDPTGPNATRIAVAAIVAARPWSTDAR